MSGFNVLQDTDCPCLGAEVLALATAIIDVRGQRLGQSTCKQFGPQFPGVNGPTLSNVNISFPHKWLINKINVFMFKHCGLCSVKPFDTDLRLSFRTPRCLSAETGVDNQDVLRLDFANSVSDHTEQKL